MKRIQFLRQTFLIINSHSKSKRIQFNKPVCVSCPISFIGNTESTKKAEKRILFSNILDKEINVEVDIKESIWR